MTSMLLVGLLAACAAPADGALVGFYEGRSTSRGGIGHAIELRADGSAVTGSAVMVNVRWHVSDGHLFVDDVDTGPFRFESGQLVQSAADGASVRKQRLGGDAAGGSVVGTWSYRHYTGAIAYERYHSDGRAEFRLPLSRHEGCYSAINGALGFTEPRPSTRPYVLKGDTLHLLEDDKEYVYDRATPWYPLEPEAEQAE